MRISYANVVATLALIFAVGGPAFAASNPGSSAPAKLKLCAAKKNGDLRMLSGSGGACKTSERAVAVDRTGLVGPAGATGATGAAGAAGERGLQGDRGQQGDRGPAGPGTVLASPDGRFTVAATNGGIVLTGPKGTATFDGEELVSDADFKITAPNALTLTDGTALTITSGIASTFTTGGALEIVSGATTDFTTGASFSQNVGGAFTQSIGGTYSQYLGATAVQNINNGFTQAVGGTYDQSIGGDLHQDITKNNTQSIGGTSSQGAKSITQSATTTFATSAGSTAQLDATKIFLTGTSCVRALGGNQIINLTNPAFPAC